jgi:hypothetical protein
MEDDEDSSVPSSIHGRNTTITTKTTEVNEELLKIFCHQG